jgi:hypothetical protein
MGKLIIPLIIGLLLGVSGGGFYAVINASKLHATAIADAKKHGIKPAGDSTHAEGDSASTSDSTSHDTPDAPTAAAHADTGHAAAVAAKPASDAEHGTETHAASATTPSATTTRVPAATPAAHAAGTNAGASEGASTTIAETQAHQRRLAKIFSTMGAKDAARVLAQMNDHDVSIILGLLADRQAAAILINLPAPRAAALSSVQPRRGGTE